MSAFINNQEFKIDKKNDPRIMANTFSSNKDKKIFNKSIFTYVDIDQEKMVKSAHLGLFKLQKCYTIIKRKLFITTML